MGRLCVPHQSDPPARACSDAHRALHAQDLPSLLHGELYVADWSVAENLQ